MSVRTRLALILSVVLLPLLVTAGLVVAVSIPDRLRVEAHERLVLAAAAVSSLQAQECLRAGDAARLMALAYAKGEPAASALGNGLDRHDGYASLSRNGRQVAGSADLPAGLVIDTARSRPCSGLPDEASTTNVAADPERLPSVQDGVEVPGPQGAVVSAVVAVPLDTRQLAEWRGEIGADDMLEIAVACPDGSTAATVGGARGEQLRAEARSAGRSATGAAGGSSAGSAGTAFAGEREVVPGGDGHPCLVLAAFRDVGGFAAAQWSWLALGAAAVLGGWLLWWLARQLTLPVIAVTDAAARAAEGDLATRLPAGRKDELGRLAASYNHMAGQLDLRLRELQESRDLLSENLQRLGDALQRTHDIDGLLSTVCAISASSTGSVRASAWLVEGNSLVCRVAWPVDSARLRGSRVPRDGSLPGAVVTSGEGTRLPDGTADPAASLGGPSMASPLQRGDSMLGALVVEREPGKAAYGDDDAARLSTITGPAGIAMDNALLHRKAQRMSVIDPLTGVGNLRMLTTTLSGEVERARHFGRSVALLIVDLDHFRVLNDTYGHAAGDATLAAVAARITATVRSVDKVARYGGEEFAVVCPELDRQGAKALADRVWQAMRAEPFDIEGQAIDVRVSVGVATWPEDARSSTELLRASDAAVAQAKRSGRDRVAQSPPSSR